VDYPTRPDVSVIIPTYNRSDRLRQAIHSCLHGNDDISIEVIIVDDGSDDNSQQLLKGLDDPRIRPLFQDHRGAQVARNRGFSESRGAYVKFLDDDDELVSGALSHELQILRRCEASISYGQLIVRREEEDRYVHPQECKDTLISGIFRGSVWTHPHVFLYERDVIHDLLWDPSISYHQDTAFAVLAATQGCETVAVEAPVGIYHAHDDPSITNNVKSQVPVCERLLARVELIDLGLQRLRERNLLQKNHLEAAAEGMWQWAHLLGAFDLQDFDYVHRRIEQIQPSFIPKRNSAVLQALDRLIGQKQTEYLIYPFRNWRHSR